MGGSIFVGIREANGDEHLMETWTNFWPHLAAHPALYAKGGSDYYQFITAPERANLKNVTTSEYGWLLLDFKDKCIASCNGYFSPGHLNLPDISLEDALQIRWMERDGWIRNVWDFRADMMAYSGTGSPRVSRVSDEKEMRARLFTDVLTMEVLSHEVGKGIPVVHSTMYMVEYCPPGWTVINYRETTTKNREAFKAYLEEHGWKARFRSRKK